MDYAIKLKNGRYVSVCDDCWYETVSYPCYLFTETEANKIATELLPKHYQYSCTIESIDGEKIEYNKLNINITPKQSVQITDDEDDDDMYI